MSKTFLVQVSWTTYQKIEAENENEALKEAKRWGHDLSGDEAMDILPCCDVDVQIIENNG